MKKKRKKDKATARKKQSTRQLIGIDMLTDYSIKTAGGELVLFIVKPTNLSVLSETSIAERIYALTTVLKGQAELEILCMNSHENFEQNKLYLRERIENEDNPVIRKLLVRDAEYLDRIQVQIATAREFILVLRLNGEKESEVLPYLSRVEKSLKEQGFTVRRAENEDIKRLLAVYYEQNVTTESFENVDGERWVELKLQSNSVFIKQL